MKFKRPAQIVALAIVVVGISRELGCVSLNIHRTENDNESETTVHQFGDKSHGWSLVVVDAQAGGSKSVQAADAAASTVDVANAVDAFRGEITQFELSGPWWLPLFKSGEISYSARITRNGGEVGDSSGTMRMRVKGLCSAHEFRRLAHKSVEDSVHDSIESQIRHRH